MLTVGHGATAGHGECWRSAFRRPVTEACCHARKSPGSGSSSADSASTTPHAASCVRTFSGTLDASVTAEIERRGFTSVVVIPSP